MNSSVANSVLLLVLGCLGSAAVFCHAEEPLEIRSPDKKVAVQFRLDKGAPSWAVAWEDRPILLPSRLGLKLADGTDYCTGLALVSSSKNSHNSTWKPVYGERSSIRDHYNALTVVLARQENPARRIRVDFRAYNEGAALCYTLPEQDGLEDFTIAEEMTQFRFGRDHRCYPVYSAQGVYEHVPLSKVKPGCERPLTVVIDDHTHAAVAEARLVDYARMRLRPVEKTPYTLAPRLASEVQGTAPYTTPWRLLMLGHTPGDLLERNYLLLNLNDPCAIEDPSWIQPGKIIREVTLTTNGGKACVDFAAEHNFQYIEYDAGWYGHENDEAQDATTVSVDPKRSKGPLDLHEVIRYAAERGIGVWLYVNRRHLERQLDEILPLYQSWGVKGVKYGFVQVGRQQWTTWLHEAVRKAAEHELMVDIHDEYRPTGYSRTYPNLLTQEGIGGNETMPTPEHNLTLPFTRYLCGAADATICWYTDRIKTSHAHQLAASVVFYSPLQFLYWYDRPQQFQGEPELQFFDHLPTVWDESRVIQGEIGKYITMARRSHDSWYVGTMNAVERRTLKIPLDFLEAGKAYHANIYSDAVPSGGAPRDVLCETRSVRARDVLEADCAANGGQAIYLYPASDPP
ncbi:MAG: glycoside hydrolase family 97 N-terminal domain-containing protein [Candidatus Hydrogenedentota bacterium]